MGTDLSNVRLYPLCYYLVKERRDNTMVESEFNKLAEFIANEIAPFSFKELGINSFHELSYIKAWKLNTWNINRAIVLLPYTEKETNLGEFVRKIKQELGKKIGYKFFIYSLGLQIVLCGEDILMEGKELQKYVDKYDNQTVTLQSIHIVDMQQKEAICVRTWGQRISGKFQDAIQKAIDLFLASFKRV